MSSEEMITIKSKIRIIKLLKKLTEKATTHRELDIIAAIRLEVLD